MQLIVLCMIYIVWYKKLLIKFFVYLEIEINFIRMCNYKKIIAGQKDRSFKCQIFIDLGCRLFTYNFFQKSHIISWRRTNRNSNESAFAQKIVDTNAAYNARQPGSIIMTIDIINHEGSSGVLRNEKEKERECTQCNTKGLRGKESADDRRSNMRVSIRVNKCLYPVATCFYNTVTPDEP